MGSFSVFPSWACPLAKPYLPIGFKSIPFGDQMAGIAPHKHCIVCGNAVQHEESFCDELCESKFKSAQRRQQIMFAVFVVLMLLILVLPALLKMMD